MVSGSFVPQFSTGFWQSVVFGEIIVEQAYIAVAVLWRDGAFAKTYAEFADYDVIHGDLWRCVFIWMVNDSHVLGMNWS